MFAARSKSKPTATQWKASSLSLDRRGVHVCVERGKRGRERERDSENWPKSCSLNNVERFSFLDFNLEMKKIIKCRFFFLGLEFTSCLVCQTIPSLYSSLSSLIINDYSQSYAVTINYMKVKHFLFVENDYRDYHLDLYTSFMSFLFHLIYNIYVHRTRTHARTHTHTHAHTYTSSLWKENLESSNIDFLLILYYHFVAPIII